jgi:hypothetical protein
MFGERFAAVLRPVVVGAAAGALVFWALSALQAQGGATVGDVLGDPGRFWGRIVSVTGRVDSVRAAGRYLRGQRVPTYSFNLYELGERRQRRHYVFVSLPASQFPATPQEGQDLTITGTLQAPLQLGKIED